MHTCDFQHPAVPSAKTQVGMLHNWMGIFAVVTQLAKHAPLEVCHPSLPAPAYKLTGLGVERTKLGSIDWHNSCINIAAVQTLHCKFTQGYVVLYYFAAHAAGHMETQHASV